MFLRMLLLAGVIASAILPASAKAERRVALVIGNAQYANASVLRNPRNDATDMAATLKTLGFEVLVGLDLDQQKFARAVESFARLLDGADVGLLFYAGHGVQINEKNYLVSTNAALKSEFLVSAEALELDAVIRLMESKVPTNLVFLDACRNNPLADELKTNLASLKRSVAVGRGLARIEPTGRDTLVAFAAAPGQEAIDGRDRNSPFTAALLKHMPKAGLEVSVMLKEVAADVRRDTNNTQRPQQLSDMSRKFFFADAQAAEAPVPPPAPVVESAPVVPAAAAAAASTDNRALDLAFWNAAQTSNECEAVRAYLTRFPNGVFVELAKLQERRLCTPARRIEVVEPAP
ncbi:MAG TPA: caspase family protein, partial [Xanthobacteraceae bacterium]